MSRMVGGVPLKEQLRRLVTFFGTSAVALVVEIGLFVLLVAIHWEPFFANLTASFTAATLAYVFNTRFAFRVVKRPTTYVLYIAWAIFIIFTASALIQLSVDLMPLAPIVWKIFYSGVTFVLNFLFSGFLFRRERSLQSNEPQPVE